MITEDRLPGNRPHEDASSPGLEMGSPSGIDLHPQPEKSVRISKRLGGMIILAGVAILGLFTYSGLKREHRLESAATGRPYKKVEPARPDEIQQGLALTTSRSNYAVGNSRHAEPGPSTELQGPDAQLPNERLVISRAPSPKRTPIVSQPEMPVKRQPTPEERALSAAYLTEQQARLAPTTIRLSGPNTSFSALTPSAGVSGPDTASPQLEALAHLLTPRNADAATSAVAGAASGSSEYDAQNLQGQKESFLQRGAAGGVSGDYLKSTRTPPLSRFELKAGWEIPAALEQGLNSDLPGELKALVMSNVYDTATGQYLLIPQGARLIGEYNSRITYGQNGVQVAWRRLIFPDGSAIDLNGMAGLDAQGNAGLRNKVDHHYKQLLGVAVLTTMFDAALAITQSRQQSVLVYPTASEETESAAGREVSQLGTQVARKNLNVQPTVRIPAGYKFNVRVNRDILFEEPYSQGPNAGSAP